MKRIFAVLLLAAAVVGTSTACNFPTFSEWCTEEGGSVQDVTEPDGDVEPHCMKDGRSVMEEEDYYGSDD